MNRILLIIISLILNTGDLFSQDAKPEDVTEPIYVVMYEIIPSKPNDCVYPMNTIMFEIPVDKEYYNSVTNNQEVSAWFKTSGNTYLIGDVNPIDMLNRWKLIVRSKKVVIK